ncbi:VOC family protein [Acuticoccus mangrovi]|uniref:VOC family protein n=1 Tax=Acuticoccus mangrovi TaxID=2796142 RepID=A0A934IRF0_9HYPH|nr:VOC family protein [Acuticoccus mangrovi]MBJ3777275.1 VOC family protein [Acuticoccus mangrovi]
MIAGLDHVVILVPDLADAMARYEALGFVVTPGGRHDIGSHNALIGFGETGYIELIAFERANPQHRWYQALAHGGGLIDVCLASDDIDQDAAALTGAGVPMAPVVAMSREKPDGTCLAWRLSFPEGADAGVMPFIITDDTPRDLRLPAAAAHPNGVTGIAAVRIALDDPLGAAARLGRVLGVAPTALALPSLGATGALLLLGSVKLQLIGSAGLDSPLEHHLRRRGEGPHSLVLTTGAEVPDWSLDDTLGVAIEFAG